eukprot:TRINITY_DN16712_c0_g1_i2.p1 TRINITY_DN16712_c0_g1~~TRINITY_DN16712_c0_g1_i2.p1  ORF type:complete len:162 (-),score=44.39 TRINITY_DN16712_c0_g1_i2:126-611(-)
MAGVDLRVVLLRHGDEITTKAEDDQEPFLDLTKDCQKKLLMITEELCDEYEFSCLMAFFANNHALSAETARIITKGIGREGEEMPLRGLSADDSFENVIQYLGKLKTKGLAMMVLVGDAVSLNSVATGLGIETTLEQFGVCSGVLLERTSGSWALGRAVSA